MKSSLDCIPCFVRQALDACRLVSGDDETIRPLLLRILAFLSEEDLTRPPPVTVSKMHRMIRDALGDADPYRELKHLSTERALHLAPEAERLIDADPFPFGAAVRFAIAGNILDFGADVAWDEEKVAGSFRKALHHPVDEKAILRLYDEIAGARTVLVLGDNAGEAVFDRLLIKRFPGTPRILYAVKGSPVINDVTETEAREAGLDRVAEIITNGTDIPGTHLPDTSPEFRRLFDEADLVISKGQGNFETLIDDPKPVWFLLQIKCASLAARYHFKHGDWIASCPRKENP